MSGVRVFCIHSGEVLPVGFEASFALPVGADVGVKLGGFEEIIVSNVILRAYVARLEVQDEANVVGVVSWGPAYVGADTCTGVPLVSGVVGLQFIIKYVGRTTKWMYIPKVDVNHGLGEHLHW